MQLYTTTCKIFLSVSVTSLRCRDIKSSSWLTRKDGGSAATPPRGIIISSRHMGHLKEPVSRDGDAAILVRQCRQTVWEHCRSFGVCSPPSYIPEIKILWSVDGEDSLICCNNDIYTKVQNMCQQQM